MNNRKRAKRQSLLAVRRYRMFLNVAKAWHPVYIWDVANGKWITETEQ